MTRHALRTDANQGAIVRALKLAGATVEIIGRPLDLLIGYRGMWALIEVKANEYESRRPSKTREGQIEFARRHPNGGPIATVWDVDGALRVLVTMGDNVAIKPRRQASA